MELGMYVVCCGGALLGDAGAVERYRALSGYSDVVFMRRAFVSVREGALGCELLLLLPLGGTEMLLAAWFGDDLEGPPYTVSVDPFRPGSR